MEMGDLRQLHCCLQGLPSVAILTIMEMGDLRIQTWIDKFGNSSRNPHYNGNG